MENMDISNNVSAKKKTSMGSRKITLDRKIDKKSHLPVTLTKRRQGIFKKAAELSLRCGADIAILVRSPEGNIVAFGSPSADAVIRRFEGESSTSGQIVEHVEGSAENEAIRDLENRDQMWWNKPIEQMGLEELKQFALKLEALQSQSAIPVSDLLIN